MNNIKIFQKEIEKHLIEFKTNIQYLPPTKKKLWEYHDMTDNLFPPIKHGFLQYVYDSGMELHEYINHVRSSQVFCVNIFFHLVKNEPNVILEVLGEHSNNILTKIIDFEFEYSSDTNILGEWKSDDNRPEQYVTSTDLFIKAFDNKENIIGFLIEVKFTEGEFGECNGYTSNRNSTLMKKNSCNDSKLVLYNFDLCYYHGAIGNSPLKRKYFDFFSKEDFMEESFQNSCPFIRNHQCLRNQSLVRALIKENKVDKAYFVLVHHKKNENIVREWDFYNKILSDNAKQENIRISAEHFVRKSKNINYKKYFEDRYLVL